MSRTTTGEMTVSDWVAEHPESLPKVAAYARGATILRMDNTHNAIEISAQLYLGENFKTALGLSQKKPKSVSHPGDHAPSFQ